MEKKRKIKLWKPIVMLIVLAVLVLLLVGILKFGSLLLLVWLVPWLAGKIAQSTGMATGLAYAASVVVSVAIVCILSLVYRKRTRKAGLALALVTFVVLSLGMWYLQRDYVFSPEGEPSRCVAATPYGYEYVSCSWDYHRIYGTKVKPVTKEIATSKFVEKSGLPRVSRLAVSKNVSFFTPEGEPLAWYYQRTDGRLEFFSRPGRHPQFGDVVLVPVNSRIVSQLFKYLDEGKTDMVVMGTVAASEHPRTPGGSELERLRDVLIDLKKE